MKKLSISFVLILICLSIIQNPIKSQDWTVTVSSQSEDEYLQATFIDENSRTYGIVNYGEKIDFKDTSFLHPGSYPDQNTAIPIYNQEGALVKAIDIHSYPGNFLDNVYVVADDQLNIYIAGQFNRRIFIQDTVIYNSDTTSSDPRSDVFLIKINEGNKVEWSGIISSPLSDECNGLIISPNNEIYISVQHYLYGTIDYFGQDSIQFSNSPYSLVKIDKSGDIVWRRMISNENSSLSTATIYQNSEGNIFFKGSSDDYVLVENDTMFQPTDHFHGANDYIIEFNQNGNKVYSRYIPTNLGFKKLIPQSDGDFLFSAHVWLGTTVFGLDTLYTNPDTSVRFIGRMDKEFQPKWYYEIRSHYSELGGYFIIDCNKDSVYAAISGIHTQYFIGEEHYLGGYAGTLLTSFDRNGIPGQSKVLKSQYGHLVVSVITDNYGEMLMSGTFRGEGWFGSDTINSDSSNLFDGFLSKFNLGKHCPFSIGNDTIIGFSGFATIEATSGYENYFWSTGDTTEQITLSASTLGAGIHKIWCNAIHGDCIENDTIMITVFDDTHIVEIDQLDLSIYPVPVSSHVILEYTLNNPSDVTFTIINQLGKQVDLIQRYQQPGEQSLTWEPMSLSSGMYFFKLQASDQVTTGKMILVR